MVKKINISPVLFIVSLFLIFTIINLTAARNTTHSTLAANGHAARFHVTIDGAPTSTVNNKIYAISETSEGVTFRCDQIPTNDIVIFIVSTMVNVIESE